MRPFEKVNLDAETVEFKWGTFYIFDFKVHIFWEGHKILQNLHYRFDRYYIGQIYDGDFT